MKKIIILALALAGCAREAVPTYSADNYIEFEGRVQDTLVMPFFLYSDATEFDFPLTVQMSGVAPVAAAPFAMAVVPEFTTAVEGTHFTMPTATAFEAEAYAASPTVRMVRTPDMKTQPVTLVLRLADNAYFRAGQWEKRTVAIKIHDMIAKPDWWDWTVQNNYLGVYSDLKFEHFLIANHHPDLSNIKGDNGRIRVYALALKRYLEKHAAQGNTVYEKDGSTKMTVPAIN